ncbi:MAG: polysaccharide deacetylase family protein [bacterium]
MNSTYNDRNIHATRMDHDLYNFSAFAARPSWSWPNGAKLAVMFLIDVEFQDLELPPGVWRPAGTAVSLDVRNWSHRDYGARVGVFRLASLLNEYGIKATSPISDMVLTRSPRVAEYVAELGWEIAGHGAKSNHLITSQMSEEDEWAYLQASRQAIHAATGVFPRAWKSPLSSESARTPFLAAKVGYDILLDWANDDQPYDMLPPEGPLTALPVSVETSDNLVIDVQKHAPPVFEQVLKDHFDALYAECGTTAMAMTVSLQAHLSGQPFRSKYIRNFVEHAADHSGVWFATASEMTNAFRKATTALV